MQQTTNYALKKIELTDSPPDITVINPNWDTIDTELKENAEALTTHEADYLKHTGYAVATGSANTYIATLNPALSAYQEGVSLRLKINVANTSASTVNVNGLGAKAIKKQNGNAVSAGNLKAGLVYTLVYDGTSFILQGEGGAGNLQPNQALAGFTFTNDDGEQVGLGDVDLIPSNIRRGKNIFGVDGEVSGLDLIAGTAINLDVKGSIGYTTSLTYVKLKEWKSVFSGVIRLKYTTFPDGGVSTGSPAYTQVWINGVPRGIERRQTTNVVATFTEDFTVNADDLIQIYGRGTGPHVGGTSEITISLGNVLFPTIL